LPCPYHRRRVSALLLDAALSAILSFIWQQIRAGGSFIASHWKQIVARRDPDRHWTRAPRRGPLRDRCLLGRSCELASAIAIIEGIEVATWVGGGLVLGGGAVTLFGLGVLTGIYPIDS
jgi:hypothetical protein